MNRRSLQDAIRLVIVLLYFLFVTPGILFTRVHELQGTDFAMYFVTIGIFLAYVGLEIFEYAHWSYRPPRMAIPRALFLFRVFLLLLPLLLLLILYRSGRGVSGRYLRFSLVPHILMLLSLLPFYSYFAFNRSIGFGVLTLSLIIPPFYEFAVKTGIRWDSTSLGFLAYRILTVLFFFILAWLLDAERQRSEENRRLLERLRSSESRLRDYADRVAGTIALEERTRLARDVHDSLGHALTAIKIQLSKAIAYHDVDSQESMTAVYAARETADEAMKDIRESLGRLNGDEAAVSLIAGLPRLIRRLDDSDVDVIYEYQGYEDGYNYSVLMGLYRFVQEGVTNILKHASASRASLTVLLGDEEATIELSDDGVGFHPSDDSMGSDTSQYGLRGLRRRLELVRGTLEVESEPGDGTRLFARVPKDPVALISDGAW